MNDCNKINCRVCNSANTKILYDFGEIPKSGVFIKNESDYYDSRYLVYHFCIECGVVFQQVISKLIQSYSDVNRGTSRQMPEYIEEVLASFNINKNDFIIEVGSNDGALIKKFKDYGFNNILGIEPSTKLANNCISENLKIECVHLNKKSALEMVEKFGHAKLVVCRHTLEHVPNPTEFLNAISTLLENSGYLFIEVPSLMPIIDIRLHGYELWDEHLSYFCPESLKNFITNRNFSLQRVEIREHCGSENILCWASINHKTNKQSVSDSINNVLEQCITFESRWNKFKSRVHEEISRIPRPIIMLGASHLQSNFIHYTDIASLISYSLDDDLSKQGHLLPAKNPIPIVGENILKNITVGSIINTAFGYPSWSKRILNEFNIPRERLISPYP